MLKFSTISSYTRLFYGKQLNFVYKIGKSCESHAFVHSKSTYHSKTNSLYSKSKIWSANLHINLVKNLKLCLSIIY